MVTLSQASCYLRHPNIDEGGKQFLKRELGSELVSAVFIIMQEMEQDIYILQLLRTEIFQYITSI